MNWNNIYLLFRINPGVGVLNAASSEFSLSSLYDIIFTINPGIIQYVKKEFSKLFFPLMFSAFSQVFYVFFSTLFFVPLLLEPLAILLLYPWDTFDKWVFFFWFVCVFVYLV